jgi:exonuclease SbcD
MRIMLSPDLHCFYDNYGKVLPDGKHSRLRDWEHTASYLLQAAVDNDVDIAVFPGDFFKNSRPAPEQIIEVATLLDSFASHGIKVVGCPGNHDLVGAGKPGPVDLIKMGCDDMMINLFSTPDVLLQIDGVNIAVLPSVKPSSLIDQAEDPAALASLVSQKLVEIARSLMVQCLEYGPGCKNVLIGHWTISGSVASSGQLLYGSTDPVIPLAELTAMEWDAVLFGHIHKAQILCEKPFVGYAGALERVDFGEEDDERGCYIIDLDKGSYEWIELPARKFLTVYANINTSDDIQVLYDRLIGKCGSDYLLLPDIASKIVRVKYKIKEELAVAIDHTKMMQALQASIPEHIAGIFPEVERSDRSRDASITEETGPVEALGKWLVEKGISKELLNEAKDVAAKLIMEVLA